MDPVEVYGKKLINLERISLRHGLQCHVEVFSEVSGKMVPHSGDSSNERDATQQEVQMWSLLCPENPEEDLVATPEEVTSSWKYRNGPFTISTKDFTAIRTLGYKHFDPSTIKEELLSGFFGNYEKGPGVEPIPIYVSRGIPTGFYYEGPKIPELHWRPDLYDKRVLEPKLPMEIECKLQEELRPFQLRG
jgi:hypothetical protein